MAELPLMTVSGIRGIVDQTLTEGFCERFARVHAEETGARLVAIGRDTRPSGARLAAAITRGFHAAGARVVDLGVSPTPTTCLAVAALGADTGVILTASHNPSPYNGYKMVHKTGRLCNADECSAVYRRFFDDARMEPVTGSSRPDSTYDPVPAHVDAICRHLDVDIIRSASLSVAVDATNGAAGVIFPILLERLGVRWVGVHTKLDGEFVHNPEPRPEHLTDLAHLLKTTKGLWGGFAFDPDADRLATMGEKGEPLSEELTLALALDNILSKIGGPVATNLSTSMVIDDVARAHNTTVIRTKIGEANVVAGMLLNACPVGGEGNGGVIYPAISTVRDGLAGMGIIIEHMAATGKKLTELTARWPTYAIVKEKIELGGQNAGAVIEKLAAAFADETTDRQDGLKIIRHNGWVHLRPSNTEPILRCYAEARTDSEARALTDLVMVRL